MFAVATEWCITECWLSDCLKCTTTVSIELCCIFKQRLRPDFLTWIWYIACWQLLMELISGVILKRHTGTILLFPFASFSSSARLRLAEHSIRWKYFFTSLFYAWACLETPLYMYICQDLPFCCWQDLTSTQTNVRKASSWQRNNRPLKPTLK